MVAVVDLSTGTDLPAGTDLPVHPLAAAFPAMLQGGYLAFGEDVRRRGVREPILLYEDQVLDGRARMRAAAAAGHPLPTRRYVGDDPIGELVSRNLARRHLDESQRAMVAAALADLRRGRPKAAENTAIAGISQGRAAALLNVSIDSVGRASAVRRDGIPALARAVQDGAVAVSAAAAIAAEPHERQAQILAFPEREILAVAKQLRLKRQGEKRTERLARLAAIAATPAPFPAGRRYPIIYADPAWEQEVWSDETGQDRGAVNHYPTETLEEIAARPVGELACDQALLVLWSTGPHLFDALRIMEGWGFRYVSNLVWIKDRTSTGYWFRSRHEHLLIGTRGGFPAPLMGTQDSSVLEAPWRGHSVKPDQVAAMIERLYPGLPRIELYARGETVRPGWDWWGYEAGRPASAPAAIEVPDLVGPGDVVRTSYGTGPYVVVAVTGPFTEPRNYGGPVETPYWNLSLAAPGARPIKATGRPAPTSWINGVRVVDGRLRAWDRDDVVVTRATASLPEVAA